MTYGFPLHTRANFERTDDLLHEIKGKRPVDTAVYAA